LPARLPFALLNGASASPWGWLPRSPATICVRFADACVALIKDAIVGRRCFAALVPGPDFPGGGQIISSAADIADAYRTGVAH